MTVSDQDIIDRFPVGYYDLSSNISLNLSDEPAKPAFQRLLSDQLLTLTAARSIASGVFSELEHAQNHCQIRNTGLALRVIVDWLDATGGRDTDGVTASHA